MKMFEYLILKVLPGNDFNALDEIRNERTKKPRTKKPWDKKP